MEAFVTRRWLLSCFEECAFDDNPAIGHLSNTHQEVLRLDLATYHLWIVINFDLLCEDSTLLIFFLHKLIPDFESIEKSLILTDNFWLILIKRHYDGLMCDLVGFKLGQTLLDRLLAGLVRCLHCDFLCCWISLKRLNHFILLLLQLVLLSLLLHPSQSLFLLFVFVTVIA